MTSTKSKKRYTKIPNELIEQFFRPRLSGHQWRILWVIIRKTFGWHKEIDRISLSTFEQKTGIPQKRLVPSLKELVERKIILKDTETYIMGYGLQKNYDLWDLRQKSPVAKKTPPEIGSPENGKEALPKIGVKPLPKSGDTKENKETSKKKDEFFASFEIFYTAYPKHKARKDALKAWEKLDPSPELVHTILTALERQKEGEDWQREGGKYIPFPATWLNGRRWEDELAPEVKDRWTS